MIASFSNSMFALSGKWYPEALKVHFPRVDSAMEMAESAVH